jgi:hypothetical protein
MSGDLQVISDKTGVPLEKLAEVSARNIANAQAMAEPLPGPVRDAFSVCEGIKCGPFTVRPCYDGDIEYLSQLGHPLHEMRLQAQANESGEVENLYRPQGKAAWELCYLFTRSLDEVDAVVEGGGLDAFRKDAKKVIGNKCSLSMLVALSTAAIKQYTAYWEPMLSYGEIETDDDEGSKKNPPAS